jgi:hypothetical protein
MKTNTKKSDRGTAYKQKLINKKLKTGKKGQERAD